MAGTTQYYLSYYGKDIYLFSAHAWSFPQRKTQVAHLKHMHETQHFWSGISDSSSSAGSMLAFG